MLFCRNDDSGGPLIAAGSGSCDTGLRVCTVPGVRSRAYGTARRVRQPRTDTHTFTVATPESSVWFEMQKFSIALFALVVFSAGFIAGSSQLAAVRTAQAAADEDRMAKETLFAYKRTRLTLNDLSDMLTSERRYRPATEGINYFALSVGGIDAIQELEEGRGVDPETFAALYADRSLPEIAEHITTDENDRIRYKGNIVRMYSRERLRQTFRQREELQNRSGGVND